jgi:UDP:flavonoid glycosyltransferase YjiC (YdhE family)
MRILMTTTRGAGHFAPLKPFADAFRADGHEVVVAAAPPAAETIRRAGHVYRALAAAPEDVRGAAFARTAGASPQEANRIVVGDLFAGIDAAAALPSLLAIVEDSKPDAIVHESCEFAAPLVGELTGVPTVRVLLGIAALEEWMGRMAVAPLDDLRRRHGLAADPDGARLSAGPMLTLTPRALEHADAPGRAARFREDPPPPREEARRQGQNPLIYVSFGSVAGQMGYFPSLYRATVEELAPLPVRVLITTGGAQDPAGLGPLPANVRAERWVQERFVMPHAAAMVSHGGSGSVRAALSSGVPLAVVPLFAEQPYNAAAVARTGAGIALQTVSGLGDAVRALLEDPSYDEAAEVIADDVAALPPAGRAIRLLERARAPVTQPRFPALASSRGKAAVTGSVGATSA